MESHSWAVKKRRFGLVGGDQPKASLFEPQQSSILHRAPLKLKCFMDRMVPFRGIGLLEYPLTYKQHFIMLKTFKILDILWESFIYSTVS